VAFAFFELIGVDPFQMGPQTLIMPAEQWVILPINHIFALMTGLVVFSLGKRLFTREVGFWAMTIYYVSNLVWENSLAGVGLPVAGFFCLSAFRSMVVAMQAKRDRLSTFKIVVSFLSSILFAVLAFYTRYISILIVPGLILFAWLSAGRFRGGTRYAFIFFVVYMAAISPWLYRNYKLTGNPAGMALHMALSESDLFPGKTYDRTLEPEITFKRMDLALKRKWVINYKENHPSLIPGMGGGLMMAFFIVTFFYHFIRPQVNYLRWSILLSASLMVFAAGFFAQSSIGMLHLFWPFVLLYGYSFFVILLNRLDMGVQLYNYGIKGLVLIISMFPLMLALMPPQSSGLRSPYHAAWINFVGKKLTERELMVSDMPWATAWYGDCTSVLNPLTVDDFYNINDYRQYVSGLFLTRVTGDKAFVSELVFGADKGWFQILNEQLPVDFPLKNARRVNGFDLFLSDRDRWSDIEAQAAQ
jgi:hypothetical protein